MMDTCRQICNPIFGNFYFESRNSGKMKMHILAAVVAVGSCGVY
jgi:hypothetical protein